MDGALVSLGNCIERAEGAASVIEAHLQALVEDPWIDEHVACRSMLQIVQAPIPQRALSRQDVLSFVVDRSQPASIASLLGAAREHATRAHDVVPTDLWDSLNTTRARSPRKVADNKVPAFISWVRERCALTVGIADTAMRQDGAWHLFTLGRSLARAEVTARLLTSQPPGGWVTVLRSGGAYQSYVRTHGSPPTAAGAVGLLVLDERHPRSILHSLSQAIQCLDEAQTPAQTAVATRDLLAELHADIAAHTEEEMLPRLTQSMMAVRNAVSGAGLLSR